MLAKTVKRLFLFKTKNLYNGTLIMLSNLKSKKEETISSMISSDKLETSSIMYVSLLSLKNGFKFSSYCIFK